MSKVKKRSLTTIKRFAWLITLTALTLSVPLLSSCNRSEEKASGEKTYTIGAMQMVEHPALDAAYTGFKRALQDKGIRVRYEFQNAQGDMNNNNLIAKNFVADNVDLIFANSTPCAQSALSATKDIPIIFTSVSDPVSAQLVSTMDKVTGNVTGTTDNHPDAIRKLIQFIAQEFTGKRIGMIYNAGEQNSVAQVDLVKQALKGTDLTIVPVTVANTSEVKQAAQSLVNRVDFIYVITDNTVVSAIKSVISVAEDEKIPLFTGEMEPVKLGAFAAYGISYEDIGYEAGEMAADILTGIKKMTDLPVQHPKHLKLVINKTAAQKMGVTLKPAWDKVAEYVQ